MGFALKPVPRERRERERREKREKENERIISGIKADKRKREK